MKKLKIIFMLHVIPLNDLKEHDCDSTCECQPYILEEGGELICVHNSYDGRECLEMTNEILNSNNK